jgi:hypothetical protein
MGEYGYTTKYETKGDGTQLNKTLAWFHNAIIKSKRYPSTHPDAATNDDREAIRVMQAFVNNSRAMECSLQLIASNLLGLPQYEFSWNFKYLFIRRAQAFVLKLLGVYINYDYYYYYYIYNYNNI